MSRPARTGHDPAAEFDRHEARRGQGVPAVTAAVGPPGASLAALRGWAETRGRGLAVATDPTPRGAVAAWAERLAAGRDLRADALAWLARRDGRPADRLGPAVARLTPSERSAYLGTVLGPEPADAACRLLLDPRPGPGPDPLSRLVALRALVTPGADPLLVLTPPGHAPVTPDWAVRALRTLAALAEAAPGLALALAITESELDTITRASPGSRASALVASAVVRIGGADSGSTDLPDTRHPARAEAARRLAAAGASPALVALFRDAADALDAGDPDRARSAAERFLFERLESLPETAGLFRLNDRPGLRFGPGPMEVDLLAPRLRLALEVDGYHHFRDPEAYRRDRRKDFELQRAGYLVVRVLAADVVDRLEDVLETTLAAVAHRRAAGPTEDEDRA